MLQLQVQAVDGRLFFMLKTLKERINMSFS